MEAKQAIEDLQLESQEVWCLLREKKEEMIGGVAKAVKSWMDSGEV